MWVSWPVDGQRLGWSIGAVVMGRLNIQRYRDFQEAGLPELLEDMRHRLWF